MRTDSLIFGVAGVFFGLLIGWIIGSNQGRTPQSAQTERPAPAASSAAAEKPAPALDEQRVTALKTAAERNAADAESRVQLGNTYFDAERYADAARWYEEALKIDPRNANASTDLGIVYYYMNQPDRALAQFEKSLTVDPSHTKTILNMGIVRAFGKQDLDGAAKAWQRVLDLAPDTPEGKAAKQMLDSLRTAHPPGSGAK